MYSEKSQEIDFPKYLAKKLKVRFQMVTTAVFTLEKNFLINFKHLLF